MTFGMLSDCLIPVPVGQFDVILHPVRCISTPAFNIRRLVVEMLDFLQSQFPALVHYMFHTSVLGMKGIMRTLCLYSLACMLHVNLLSAHHMIRNYNAQTMFIPGSCN